MRRSSDPNKKYLIVDGQHRYRALLEKGFPGLKKVRCELHESLTESSIVTLRLDQLEVHPDAQKAINPSHLRRLVNDFNIGSLGVLSVVDPEIVSVPVASKLFLQLNNRSSIGSYEKFKNRLQSGDPAAVACHQICNGLGLKVQKTAANGAIMATDALLRGYGIDGGVSLEKALRCLLAAWGAKKESVTGVLVSGFAEFFKKYPNASVESLAKKLSRNAVPSRFEGDIRAYATLRRESNTKAAVFLIHQEYNRKRNAGRLAA